MNRFIGAILIIFVGMWPTLTFGASSSTSFSSDLEDVGSTETYSSSTNFNSQAEIGGPTEDVASSTSFVLYQGGAWIGSTDDTIKPEITSKSPTGSETGVSISTNIVVTIEDLYSYPSGGVHSNLDPNTCRV